MTNFWETKKVLVTGGAGFIGSSLVKSLVSFGANVHVIDNLWRGSISNLIDEQGNYIIDIETKFHLVDLTDYSKALEFIKDFDVVYHLADVVAGVNFVFNNEIFIYRQNILINSNTLAACLFNYIKNYVYVGTACSYPKHLQMVDSVAFLHENQTYPADPESSYGWSKLMGEYETELVSENAQINVGLLRLHNVYGPRSVYDEQRSQVIPSLIRKAIFHPHEDFIVWGSGGQYRDFVYVDDVVNALLLVFERGMNKGLIQIGSEIPTSIHDLAEMIVSISGKDIHISYDETKPEGDRGRVAVCDRARNILNWHPRIDLREGLTRTYNWIDKKIRKNVDFSCM
ncbi:MAG: NAD-dependent epimerase/dehydratase family protein [bacterium]